jgi:hypothetical protein
MTLAEINEAIAHAEDLKDRVRNSANEEEVAEYRRDMYARIDRINDRLVELYQERQWAEQKEPRR